MAGRVHEVAFKIAGKLAGSFAKSFGDAGKTVQRLNTRFEELNRKAGDLRAMRAQAQATEKAKAEWEQAQHRAAKLGEQIKRLGVPTQRQAQAFEAANRASDKVKQSFQEQELKLKELSRATGIAETRVDKLTAEIEAQARAANAAKAPLEKLASLNERIARVDDLSAKNSAMRGESMGALAGIGAGVGALAMATVKPAMAMEDAMADVAKVAKFKDADGLAKLQKDLEEMSLRIPVAADGLAQIAAAAGGAGIAGEDLKGFTEQAAKMAVAFDITADQAGTMMAKWQSGMKLSLPKTYALADATNALSNNNAALASQIGEVLQRTGALAKVSGVAEQDYAALAASAIAAGASAEEASTGLASVLTTMGKGQSLGLPQQQALAAIGIDPETLKEDLSERGAEAVLDMLQTIHKVVPKDDLTKILNGIFGETGHKALAPMLTNLAGLRDNLDLVKKGTKGSMGEEFAARAKTTSNALVLVKNAASYAARAVGNGLLGPLREASLAFVGNAQKVGDWLKKNQELVMGVLKVAGVVVGAIAAFHAMRIAVSFLISPFLSLYRGYLLASGALVKLKSSTMMATIATKAQAAASLFMAGVQKTKVVAGMVASTIATKAQAAASLFMAGVQKTKVVAGMVASTIATKAHAAGLALVAGAQKALNLVMLAAPYMWIVAAIVAVIAVGVLLYKNWDTIKAKAGELWLAFQEKFPAMANIIKAVGAHIMAQVNKWKAAFGQVVAFVKNVFTGQWGAAWQNVKNLFAIAFGDILAAAKGPLNGVIGYVNKAIAALNGISFSVPDWVPAIGGKSFSLNIPQVPQLAKGGIATSSTLANIGEAGPEAVIPLSRLDSMLSGGGGGGTINVTFSPTINVSGGSGDVPVIAANKDQLLVYGK